MERWLAGLLALLAPMGAAATVNLNTAQQSELQRVQGLDRYKAKAIIEYRDEHGAFRSFGDLEKMPGLDAATLEKIRTQVAFSGPAYVPPPKGPKREKAEGTMPARHKPAAHAAKASNAKRLAAKTGNG